jgi:hypothetical protein
MKLKNTVQHFRIVKTTVHLKELGILHRIKKALAGPDASRRDTGRLS